MDAEENTWTYEGGGNFIMGSFLMYPPGELLGSAVEDSEMGWAEDRLGREVK